LHNPLNSIELNDILFN